MKDNFVNLFDYYKSNLTKTEHESFSYVFENFLVNKTFSNYWYSVLMESSLRDIRNAQSNYDSFRKYNSSTILFQPE